jgi:N-acetylglucosamine kinase-like BadF-type ATPase
LSKFPLTQGYLLGVDTGTSKTHALITDLSGRMVGFGEAGCGNYEVVGKDGLIDVLNSSVAEAIESAQILSDNIVGMGFGFSGYDWPSEETIMEQAIGSLSLSCPYQFVNDVTIGLFAGASQGWGVAVDAGTGNNVRGRDKLGNIGRITGNSISFGEFGGAGEMVFQARLAATYAWTQRGPKTKITQMLMAYAEVNHEEDLIEGLAMEKIHLPPILAKNILQLATEGDKVAQEVVNFSAKELAKNVNAVIRQLNFQNIAFEVILIGSIFKAGEIYLKPFRATIHEFAPNASLIQLSLPPVTGAILLASETLGLQISLLREKLIQTTKKLPY